MRKWAILASVWLAVTASLAFGALAFADDDDGERDGRVNCEYKRGKLKCEYKNDRDDRDDRSSERRRER
ncbi:MAG: hypothetical protein AB1760_16900 [Pseudomonadota bacterium]